MKRPVRANDGYVYEERALQEHERHCQHLKQTLCSPLTKEPMEPGAPRHGTLRTFLHKRRTGSSEQSDGIAKKWSFSMVTLQTLVAGYEPELALEKEIQNLGKNAKVDNWVSKFSQKCPDCRV